jgi:hypothetical protein
MMDDEAQAKLIAETCMSGDEERDHIEADRIMVSMLAELGYQKTAAAWEAVRKWYA